VYLSYYIFIDLRASVTAAFAIGNEVYAVFFPFVYFVILNSGIRSGLSNTSFKKLVSSN
jgi:hypothetical protein